MNAFLVEALRDLLVFGGLVILSGGCYLIYEPLAFVVAGALLMAIGLFVVPTPK